MIAIYLKINVTDSSHNMGKRLTKDYPQYEEEFARYMATVLRDELKLAIKKQRYLHKWKPLSIPYVKYKERHNLSTNTWQATGLLLKSIVFRKRNGYYLVGIDPYKRYKSGIKVLEIAKYMEYGTSKMPPRPLFRPIISYLSKNIGRYWKKFLLEKKGIKL